ncbi:hypothetical protein J5X98_09990 [Leptothermofonsia sichuanensis E412]|jgi:hypothetical protein|uniref:hypothetical protein n=1 Tax=Leptothermofonsia sichuanensis TaxID=2917832 RepID=UPI001CA637E0|nr:hypothetical protein [Leptothermofonsia sichuanensis]QZZ22655.1 hypothetical protein J5X98_09990 [Leptothermofonsia sichuanensis E412]
MIQYSIIYKPHRNRKHPWILKVWEPAPAPRDHCKVSYLFNAQYWLKTQAEAQAILAEFQQVPG